MNKWIKYGLLILLPVGLLLWATFERTAWDEEFTIEDGRLGMARFTYLNWRFWGGHVISIGGENISCSGTFRLESHRSHWKSKRHERIFAVQFREQRWYAISLDRTHVPREMMIRFYSGKDGETLQEIEPHDYPLKLAIQNLWLHDEDVKVLSEFPAGDYWARESLLAKAWWKVVHGEDVKEVEQEFIEKIAKQEFPGRVSFLPPQKGR